MGRDCQRSVLTRQRGNSDRTPMWRYSVVLVELYEKARGHGRWHHRRPDPLQFNQPIAFHHPKGTRKAWNLAPAVLGQFGERPGLKFA